MGAKEKLMSRVRRFVSCERGTHMIEFSLALPFLLTMFAGAVELGRLFYTYTTLTKATVVGARYLSAPATPVGSSGYASSDLNIAKNMMVCNVASSSSTACDGVTPVISGFTTSNITVTAPSTTGNVRYVTVSISYSYSPAVFGFTDLTGVTGYTLTPQTTMRYLLD